MIFAECISYGGFLTQLFRRLFKFVFRKIVEGLARRRDELPPACSLLFGLSRAHRLPGGCGPPAAGRPRLAAIIEAASCPSIAA